jgi:hypothetical protein
MAACTLNGLLNFVAVVICSSLIYFLYYVENKSNFWHYGTLNNRLKCDTQHNVFLSGAYFTVKLSVAFSLLC